MNPAAAKTIFQEAGAINATKEVIRMEFPKKSHSKRRKIFLSRTSRLMEMLLDAASTRYGGSFTKQQNKQESSRLAAIVMSHMTSDDFDREATGTNTENERIDAIEEMVRRALIF